jgi:hypothetical protein
VGRELKISLKIRFKLVCRTKGREDILCTAQLKKYICTQITYTCSLTSLNYDINSFYMKNYIFSYISRFIHPNQA